MLPEMSTQNSMFVSTRRAFGSAVRTGPAAIKIPTAARRGRSDSAVSIPARSQPPPRWG